MDALLEPTLDAFPFEVVDDPRHDIKRPHLLSACLVAVDVERDAHVQQRRVGRLLSALQLPLGKRHQPAGQKFCAAARLAPRLKHFVVEVADLIGVEFHTSAYASPASLSARNHPMPINTASAVEELGTSTGE